MDPQCLHWTLIVKTWLKTFPKFIPEAIRDKLTSLFDRFCIPLLKVRNKAVQRLPSLYDPKRVKIDNLTII